MLTAHGRLHQTSAMKTIHIQVCSNKPALDIGTPFAHFLHISNGLIIIKNCIIFFCCCCCHSYREIAANYYHSYVPRRTANWYFFFVMPSLLHSMLIVRKTQTLMNKTRCRLSIFRYSYQIFHSRSRPCKPHSDFVIKHTSSKASAAVVRPTGCFAGGISNLHWIRIYALNLIVKGKSMEPSASRAVDIYTMYKWNVVQLLKGNEWCRRCHFLWKQFSKY